MAQQGAFVNPQPYKKTQAITLSDVTVYSPPLDALYVGGAGTINLVDEGGNATSVTAVAGAILPISTKQVKTGGTATLIIGLNW